MSAVDRASLALRPQSAIDSSPVEIFHRFVRLSFETKDHDHLLQEDTGSCAISVRSVASATAVESVSHLPKSKRGLSARYKQSGHVIPRSLMETTCSHYETAIRAIRK